MSDGEAAVRALRPADAGAARAVVSACTGGTRYAARTTEVLEAALIEGDDEHVGLVLPGSADQDGAACCSAIAVIGSVGGADGAWRLHWLFAHALPEAMLIAGVARDAARDRGARLLVAELPDDVPFSLASEAVASVGFVLEGSVPDFVTAGIALRLWVARL